MPEPTLKFEQTVAKMNKHTTEALQILAAGLGTTWDASDVAYCAGALGAGEMYINALRKVFNGEKLAAEP